MDLWILDTDFQAIAIIDDYESVLWVDRYNKPGEIEIYLSPNSTSFKELQIGRYLYKNNTDHLMIIEGIEIKSDVESGVKAIITGRSLESILDRRIIWNQTILDGNFQNAVKKLLDDAIINPTNTNRKIENFFFKESTDEKITGLTVEAQFTGDDLLEAITSMCESANVGFKITLNESNQFIFELYVGTDRTYEQTATSYVIFSNEFENLLNSDYITSNVEYKTVTLVAGEESGETRKTIEVGDITITGLERRELYTDARDIQSRDGDATIPDDQYYAQLTERGNEKLAECKKTNAFEGEADTNIMFKYGVDFFMGDIIQLKNEFGIEGKVRVTEFIISENDSGHEEYPTFVMIDEEV